LLTFPAPLQSANKQRNKQTPNTKKQSLTTITCHQKHQRRNQNRSCPSSSPGRHSCRW
jgi:hypothetical protein